jgi:HD-GYP domain-containing protein (c-di-GMP phosphodiesterase class II)
MPLEEALGIVRTLVDNNQLDREIFECLEQHSHECYQLSIGEQDEIIDYVPALTVGEK